MSSRTTSISGIVSLLGAFLASAMVLGLLLAGLFMPAVSATGALARSGVDVFNELPSEFTSSPLLQQSKILAADGKTVIATPQDQNRIVVKLDQVAPVMRQAQIAIEDHRFYEHGGVDMQGIMRAFLSNLRSGGSQGASSLTQQYVKISLQYTALQRGDKEAAAEAVDQNYIRKLRELKYAITLEKKWSKDQILEAYLNTVYYGDLAYGVEAAAQHYFSIPASKLSISQAALLAGLTQNPGTTDPVNHPDRALARRNVVLERMHELGMISDKDYAAAKKRTIKDDLKVTQPKSTCLASPYPYWCEFILNYALEMPALGKTAEERRRNLYAGGYVITTTLDPKIQQIVQEEVTRKVPIGDKSEVGAAAYTTDQTGHVLGFAQNTEYTVSKQSLGKTGVSWALDTRYGGSGGFQFGSTAKAFSLVTAMENGMNTKSTVRAKAAGGNSTATYVPSEFPNGCGPGGPWRVHNDSPFRGGNISLMQATALSTNTAFVALAQKVGGCKVRETMMKLGLHRADGGEIGKYAPQYILGADEVSPQGVAHAYATIANDGKKCPMVVVSKMTKDGKEVKLPKTECEQVVSADAVRATDKFLVHNMTNGSGIRNQLEGGGRQSAGKTGTSDKNNESWFVGYTPQLVTAVWVGTPDDGNKRFMKNLTIGGQFVEKMHGASVAAPIWKAIMDRALQGEPRLRFKEPSQKLLEGDQVAVPGVTGMTVEDATKVLKAAGFTASVGGSMDSNVEKDRVAGTSPYGRAERGSDITIYTSRGPQETKKDEKKPEPNPKPSDTKPGKGKGRGEPGIPPPPKND